jgi:surface antigen
MSEWSLEELMGALCNPPNSQEYMNAQAVITIRQTQAQLDACAAQIRAAEAETKAAEAAVSGTAVAERNARYVLASVIVAAIAAIASAVSALATVHLFK